MIRAVLDTNIVVSALLRSGGFPEAIFNLGIDQVIQLYVSEPILECAQAAEAEYLVTGNPSGFPESWATARIVTLREFLEVIADTHREEPPAVGR